MRLHLPLKVTQMYIRFIIIDHDNCPFLSNKNRCRIHEQKPLICQAYPLMTFGILGENTRMLKKLGLADFQEMLIIFP
ncbi:MAG: YkgJ family cysteine cluster protein [Candidatus Bathyarchaeia archaeon]